MDDLLCAPWRKSSRSSSSGGECVEVAPVWRKSSRSNASGGNCVEVAADERLAVRDSKNPDQAHLTFSRTAWTAFTRTLEANGD